MNDEHHFREAPLSPARQAWLMLVVIAPMAACYPAIRAGLEFAPSLRFGGLRTLVGGLVLLLVLAALFLNEMIGLSKKQTPPTGSASPAESAAYAKAVRVRPAAFFGPAINGVRRASVFRGMRKANRRGRVHDT